MMENNHRYTADGPEFLICDGCGREATCLEEHGDQDLCASCVADAEMATLAEDAEIRRQYWR